MYHIAVFPDHRLQRCLGCVTHGSTYEMYYYKKYKEFDTISDAVDHINRFFRNTSNVYIVVDENHKIHYSSAGYSEYLVELQETWNEIYK